MRSERQTHYVQQRRAQTRAQARAMTITGESHRAMTLVAYALLSAIVALWMAYLSSVTGSILTRLNVVPAHLALNGSATGERSAGISFDDRWKAVAAIDALNAGRVL